MSLAKFVCCPFQFSEYELMIASHLVDPCSMVVSWENIGGLGDVIQEIKDTIILPIKRKDLFAQSKLTQPPKGIRNILRIIYLL